MTQEQRKNPWLKEFEEATEEGKLKIIYEVAHLATINSVSKEALRAMFCWLVDYAVEEVQR